MSKISSELLLEVWNKEILKFNPSVLANQNNPQGFVLGGQPGAGKSSLIAEAKNRLNRNILEINGDNFRKYHPDYEILQEKYAEDAPKYTAEFAGAMTEAIFQKALNERYNIVIEGTFRTAQTPINTLQKLKDSGYETTVLVQTCNQDISWASCLERYNKMKEVNPKEARFTPKEHHDLVVENLSKNIKEVAKSGLVDNMQVFVRTPIKGKENQFEQKEIYNSNSKKLPNGATIDKYIFGERRLVQDSGLSFGW